MENTVKEQKTAVALRRVGPTDRDLHQLIKHLDEELLTRYPSEGIYGLDFDSPEVEQMTFIVAYLSEKPVGCGALRPLEDGYCELKRFYVDPSQRRQGIASAMLRMLLQQARDEDYDYMRLETGPRQPEAIALYERAGFYHIGLYGPYNCEDYSTCMEIKL